MVHVDGKRSVLLTILKNGNVSTLDIANGIKKMMPSTLAASRLGSRRRCSSRNRSSSATPSTASSKKRSSRRR